MNKNARFTPCRKVFIPPVCMGVIFLSGKGAADVFRRLSPGMDGKIQILL
jgi:hypothetical protein